MQAVAPDIAVAGLLARPGKALYMSRPSHSAVWRVGCALRL